MQKLCTYIQELIEFLLAIEPIEYAVQIAYLRELLDLIKNAQNEIFYKKINSIELWGGSGSLWENKYGMTMIQREHFETLLLKLLEELKTTGKIGRQATTVQKILMRLQK